MIEKPILMNAAMVRATLRDVDPKWQTRRLDGMDNLNASYFKDRISKVELKSAMGHDLWCFYEIGHGSSALPCFKIAPRYSVGDRLWVRETFTRVHPGLLQKLDPFPDSIEWMTYYRADGESSTLADYGVKWKPAIHMPRKFSRITLEVTEVRVQRLQDISEEDAKAEGITDSWPEIECNSDRPFRDGFKWLWESINGKGSWAKNPWVFAISFRRITNG